MMDDPKKIEITGTADLLVGVDYAMTSGDSMVYVRKNEDGTFTQVDPPKPAEQVIQETVEKQLGLVGSLSGKPPTPWQGPLRKAPTYYVGTHIGQKDVLHIDTEVRVIKKGSGFTQKREVRVGGIRNKAARRMLRGRLKQRLSSVDASVHNAHLLRAEVNKWGDSPGERRRLLEETLERAKKKEDK